MGRIDDALKKAEEERRKKREARTRSAKTEDTPVSANPASSDSDEHLVFEEDGSENVTMEVPITPVPPTPPPSAAKPSTPEPAAADTGGKGVAGGFIRANKPLQPLTYQESPRQFGETLISVHNPSDVRCEQFRAMRTNLLVLDPVPKVLSVTSAVAGEGIGLTVGNLAVILAENESQRVLVVDADFRSTELADILGVPNSTMGLAEVLEGRMQPGAVITDTGIDRVFFIASGHHVENPGVILSGDALSNALSAWRATHDWVIVCSPPAEGSNDSAVIGRCVDSAVVVVRMGETPRKLTEKTIDALAHSGVDVAGVVLTNSERASS